MKLAAEKSLKTLGVDCIDLYYLHRLLSSTFVDSSSGEAIEHCLFLHYSYQTPISTHHQIKKNRIVKPIPRRLFNATCTAPSISDASA